MSFCGIPVIALPTLSCVVKLSLSIEVVLMCVCQFDWYEITTYIVKRNLCAHFKDN